MAWRREAGKAVTISRYTDHAANERTFLAWIRTALAIIAFGCFLARLDVFLHVMVHGVGTLPVSAAKLSWSIGTVAGVLLVVSGTTLLPLALWRYHAARLAILSPDPRETGIGALGGVLVSVLVLAGCCALALLLTSGL